MKSKDKRKEPEIILRKGKPAAVILDIDAYQDMLERLEDAENLEMLAEMRQQTLAFRKLEDSLARNKKTRSPKKILKIIEENRDKIKSYGVRRLGLFGSGARGEATEASDLDFVVDLETKTFDNYMGLKEFLEELFRTKVDLVLVNTIKPRLRDSILNEAVHVPGL